MADTGHKRAQRVAQLIQESLARLLVEGLKDPRVGFVTVTEVRLTSDLRQARVFVSVFGDETQRLTTLAGLRAAHGYLRRELGHFLQLRVVPDLEFVHDNSLDRAQRLQTVLNAAKRGDLEAPPVEFAQAALPEAHTARSGSFEPPPMAAVSPGHASPRSGQRKTTGTAAARRGSTRSGRRRRCQTTPRLA